MRSSLVSPAGTHLLFWALAVVQCAVGVLEGAFAMMALGLAQGAGLLLSGSDEPAAAPADSDRRRKALTALLIGPAAIAIMVAAAIALDSLGPAPSHRLSLWIAGASTALVLVFRHDGGASVTLQTLFALGAVIGGECGWDWSDPLGGLLLANTPLRTAWSAVAERFKGAAPPDRAGSANRRPKSA